MGTFPMEMTSGHAQVLQKALLVAQEAEREKEERLVKTVVTSAAKGREGVVSLDETLGAVHAGRVQTLVVSEGFRAPGFRCQGCDYLTSHAPELCPFCGGNFEKIPDAVELAVRRVMADGGDVVVIYENDALEQAGRIGALLRY
jgi:peptide subunit release factor 1 (eRF1)